MNEKFKCLLNSKLFKECVILALVVLVSLLIIPIAGVQIDNNASRWLTEANKIYLGQSVQDIYKELSIRRPFFPAVLALGFKIGGKSVQSAILVTRIFFGLQIILIYLIGRLFYDKAAGLFACGLVVTSFGINSVARYIDTDIILPFFVLLFLLVYYLALKRSSRLLAIIAGVSLMLSITVKEAAWFCLFIPFAVFVLSPAKKRRACAKISLWLIVTIIIVLAFGTIYIFYSSNSFKSILDVVHYQYEAATWRMIGFVGVHNYRNVFIYWSHMFAEKLPKYLSHYYQAFLKKVTPLSIFMIIGYAFIFLRGLILKKIPDLIISASVFCALPIILRISEEGDRIGQSAFLYTLLYISFAVFIASGISFMIRTVKKWSDKHKKIRVNCSLIAKYPQVISRVLIVFAGFFLFKAQLFNKNLATWKLWTEGGDSLSIFLKKPFEIYGRFTNFQEEAGQWLRRNAGPGAKIIADGFTNEALDFYNVVNYKIPVFFPVREIGISQAARRIATSHKPSLFGEKSHPLFIFTYSNFESGIERTRSFYVIYEGDIIAALKTENPNYLVLSERSLFLKKYFELASWAKAVFDNQRVVIYEIQGDQIASFSFPSIGVNETINDDIAWLEKNHPGEVQFFLEAIESLGLTLDEIKNSPLRIPKGQTY